MIYHSFNFVDSFNNASGNRKHKMVLGELGKLINNHPNEVITAIKDAEIKVPNNLTKRGIVKIIMQNKRNRRLINNLSVLIYASAHYDNNSSSISNFLYSNTDGDGSTDSGTKSNWMAQIGNFFKARAERKKTASQEEDGLGGEEGAKDKEARKEKRKQFWQKIGSFFKKNKENIGNISTSLANSIQSQRASSDVNNTSGGGSGNGSGSDADKNKNITYIVIGAVVLAGAYFLLRKK